MHSAILTLADIAGAAAVRRFNLYARLFGRQRGALYAASMSERVLLVSGGGRSIGAATCRLAGARGYRVAVNYRQDAGSTQKVVTSIENAGSSGVALQANVTEPDEVERLFAEIAARLGRVTHFVNNAGITGPASRLDEASTETLRSVLDLNVYGALLCARAAARWMSTSRGGPGGVIVNVSSGAATLGSPASGYGTPRQKRPWTRSPSDCPVSLRTRACA